MFLAGHINAGAIEAAQRGMQVHAHNLANSMSDGFCRKTPVFTDVVYQSLVGPGGGRAMQNDDTGVPAMQAGTGTRVVAVQTNFQRGMMEPTKNKFDIAIQGPGFLQVDLGNNQVAYTRSGHLRLDEDGNLLTSTGYKLTDNIQVDLTRYKDMVIAKDGQILGVLPDNTYDTLGQLTLWKFVNPGGLMQREDTLFTTTPNTGQATQANPGEAGFGDVMQGYIERSNVDGPMELVKAALMNRFLTSNSTMLKMDQETQKSMLQQISMAT
jgi:flagellar basal-body rod protein FlgG